MPDPAVTVRAPELTRRAFARVPDEIFEAFVVSTAHDAASSARSEQCGVTDVSTPEPVVTFTNPVDRADNACALVRIASGCCKIYFELFGANPVEVPETE